MLGKNHFRVILDFKGPLEGDSLRLGTKIQEEPQRVPSPVNNFTNRQRVLEFEKHLLRESETMTKDFETNHEVGDNIHNYTNPTMSVGIFKNITLEIV